jgi:hypothetical protein
MRNSQPLYPRGAPERRSPARTADWAFHAVPILRRSTSVGLNDEAFGDTLRILIGMGADPIRGI